MNTTKIGIGVVCVLVYAGCQKTRPYMTYERYNDLREDRIEAKIDAIVQPAIVDCDGYAEHDQKAFKEALQEAIKSKYHFLEFGSEACGSDGKHPFFDLTSVPKDVPVHVFGGYITNEKDAIKIDQTEELGAELK